MYFRRILKWAWLALGVGFAGVIVNPNYTSKHSFYLRKFNIVLFGYIFYSFGRKKEEYFMLNMLLKMNDYLPMEVR